MVGLKQHALPIAFYILTIVLMIKCECYGKTNNFGTNIRVCPNIKYYHPVYYDSLRIRIGGIPADEFFNYRTCRNVNISDEYVNDRLVQFLDVSNSMISTLEHFTNICCLKFNNITMNISNTHLLNATKLQSLSIRSSSLSTFDFAPISSLIILDLSDNALTSLNTTNFRNFKLDILNVSSNRLSNIYCENVSLEIDLSYNSLDTINCKFATSLKHLYLNNNYLRNISIDAFKDMHNLLQLNLSYNQLNEVPHIFSDLEKLVHLNLSNNNIYRFHFGCFVNLKSLKNLDLSYNEIVSLSHGFFNGLDDLKILDLSYNDIFELDVGIFYPSHFLTELYLEGNFLQDSEENILNKLTHFGKISITFADISCHKLKKYVDILEYDDVQIKRGPYIYLDNVNGIKCNARNTTDLHKFSFELTLNSLKNVHVTLTIITICFLILMIMFVVIQYYRYKM